MKVFTKIVLTVFIIGAFLTHSFAQESDQATIEGNFYKAYIMNSVPAWKIALGQLEATKKPSLLLAKGYYGAAGTAMGNRNEDLAEEMLDKAEGMVKEILDNDQKSVEGNALLSSVYGMQIGLSPMKGMYLGSKSSKLASKALKLAPENPFANFIKGSSLFYTPSLFGGDVKKSITHLEKAKTIHEKNGTVHTWEYMNTLALLGQVYYSEKEYQKAKTVYETALKTAPDFIWVKKILLPKTVKAMDKA